MTRFTTRKLALAISTVVGSLTLVATAQAAPFRTPPQPGHGPLAVTTPDVGRMDMPRLPIIPGGPRGTTRGPGYGIGYDA